jgi:hypothetical protein
MAAVAALLVERQPNSRVPRRVVRTSSWVARTSQAHARRSDERDREAGADEATYFAILGYRYVRFHFAERREASFFVAVVVVVV